MHAKRFQCDATVKTIKRYNKKYLGQALSFEKLYSSVCNVEFFFCFTLSLPLSTLFF